MHERLVGHHRPQVGAADADIDDISDGFSGVPLPMAVSNLVAETGHAVQHPMNAGHHVFAVHHDLGANRCPKGRVQHGTFFGDVDFFPSEHGINPVLETAFPRQIQKQFNGFIGDTVLGKIQINARCFSGHPLAAAGISLKEFAEMEIPDPIMVLFQGLPCRSIG